MSVPAQNTLLKLIEEPPLHAVFIFTSSTKSVFLPTILSRIISLGVNEVSHEDCRKALFDRITSYNVCYTKLLRRGCRSLLEEV